MDNYFCLQVEIYFPWKYLILKNPFQQLKRRLAQGTQLQIHLDSSYRYTWIAAIDTLGQQLSRRYTWIARCLPASRVRSWENEQEQVSIIERTNLSLISPYLFPSFFLPPSLSPLCFSLSHDVMSNPPLPPSPSLFPHCTLLVLHRFSALPPSVRSYV